ncbi:MAG: Ig-like domain-containing protein [Eggerthellaceae bacterium]|nr:Ig-like domain-containing protein [Eggerthellaceae bacterium]
MSVALVPSSAFAMDNTSSADSGIVLLDDDESADNPEGNEGEGSGESGSEGNEADEPTEEEETGNYVTALYLKWSADYDGPDEFVGDSDIAQLDTIEIMRKGQLVQLNAYYTDNSGDGVLYETANSDNDMGSIDVRWTSSNTDVATVDTVNGLVTARGNGEVTITAEIADPDKYGAATASVNFLIDGQEGEYVSKVEITDDAGEIITDTIVIETEESVPVYRQLEAIIYWVDADGNETRTEYTGGDAVAPSTSVRWSTGGETSVLYVNESTGRIATQGAGIGSVIVSVEGGVGGATISDTVYVRVDTGQYSYNPADSLTINVSYESYPEEIYQSKTYSLDDLANNLEQITNNYTVINSSWWATIRATGYRFYDLIQYVNNDMGIYIDMDDILQFRFGTADAYDSPISYSYLFGVNRFYYPDYDINYTGTREIVPPLLALAAYTNRGVSYVDPNQELDEGIRFRLVFGVSSPTDYNTSKQVYYIDTINIIIKGSQPEAVNPGTSGGTGNGGEDGEGSGSGGDGFGNTNGSGGSGGGTGGGNGTGSGTGVGSAESGTGSAGDAGTMSTDSGISGGGGIPSSSSGSSSSDEGAEGDENASETSSEDEGEGLGTSGSGTDTDWKYYQTLIKSNSYIGDLDLDNPLSPYALPAGIGAFCIGGITSFIGYRRRLF